MTVIVNPDPGYTTGDEVTQSEYQDVMHAPLLFQNAVDDDATQGVACLWDYTSCAISWNANQVPTLQLNYPLDGEFIDKIQRQMIIIGDVNRNLTHQKFRIIDANLTDTGLVVNATHIIGEFLSNNPLVIDKIQMPNASAGYAIGQILGNLAKSVPSLNYDSDVTTPVNIDMDVSSSNALNALLDPDQQGDKPVSSVLANYGGDFWFDNFTIYHRQHAGKDSHITFKYGERTKSQSLDKSIENTYTGLLIYANYIPGQALATQNNVDWSSWGQDWKSIGSVTYAGGKSIEIYDSPVQGHNVVGTLVVGQKLKLGKPVSNGQLIPNPKNPKGTLEIDTVNGHTWYPINGESDNGIGGWVDSTWINFSKTGDYLINDAIGHVTVDVKGTDTKLTRYPISGTATVNYPHKSQKIHVFQAPDPGKDHHWTGKTLKHGTRVHYDYVDIDESGTKWYRIGPGQWLYGPHLSLDKDTDIQVFPTKGEKGLVKKTANVYNINTKTGKVTQKHQHLSVAAAKKKHQSKYKVVVRGKGKKRHKVKIKNPNYRVGKPLKQKHAYRVLKNQVVVGGTTYYKISNGTYVKSSDIDWKARWSSKPKSPDKIIANVADTKGKVEIYTAPSYSAHKRGPNGTLDDGYAANWSIPDGTPLAITHTAQGADGSTWYEVTYKGVTGYIPAENTNTDAVGDIEPYSPDEDDGDQTGTASDSTASGSVDDNQVKVLLTDDFPNVVNGVYYPDGMYESENARIYKLDASSYFQHDNQDVSGQQDDGSFVATDGDRQQLYQLVPDAVKQYGIGKFPVNMTITPADMDGIEADLTQLNMYDTAHVDFVKYGDKIEDGKVTATEWEMKGEDSNYRQITLGEPPQTYYHLLTQKIEQKAGELRRSQNNIKAHTGHLFTDIANALAKEGSDRQSAEKDIMKDVGILHTVTDKHGQEIEHMDVSLKDFDSQLQTINSDVTNLRNNILNGGTQELQFLDAGGNQNFLHPTQIRAVNPDGTYLDFNSEGLGFFDSSSNQIRSAIGADGRIAAESIDTGTINALNVRSCTLHGDLIANENGQIAISIGTKVPPHALDSPSYGGSGIWLDSANYHTMISSGRITIRDDNGNYTSLIGSGLHINGTSLKSLVESWIRDTITIGKHTYKIWEG